MSQAVAVDQPLMLITDRATLSALEADGLSLGSLLGAPDARSTKQLSDASALSTVTGSIAAEVEALLTEDEAAGLNIQAAHRVFNPDWLRSSSASFELVGITNRMDRTPFDRAYGRATTCGEVRLVYRLAYRVPRGEKTQYSRLPMTLNLGFPIPMIDGGCQKPALRWQVDASLTGKNLAAQLRSDNGALVGPERLAGVAVNLQLMRWPSSVHKSFGGHSEYLLTRYAASRTGGKTTLKRTLLENTPDFAKLRSDKKLRAELVAFLRKPASLKALDQGTIVLPEKFLATRSISAAPHGFDRKINRPWRRAVSAKAFRGLDLSKTRTIRSPAALVRRLDALSCAGCHQARSHAGFHLLGEDPTTQKWDAMAVPVSPHLGFDLKRREARHVALIAGTALDELQPSAERDGGRYGSHCGLPPDPEKSPAPAPDPELSTWGCAKGLKCTSAGSKSIGLCTPKGGPRVGDPCDLGKIVSWTDPRRDRAVGLTVTDCRGSRCVRVDGGLPQGMCRAFCGASKRVACGVMPGGGPFNGCLAARQPFAQCIEDAQLKVGLRPCSLENPCRDDYLCARPPDNGPGTCIPPYFLFQLRVDGHPDPPAEKDAQ